MKIALFYLAKPKYGGWVTFTSHLYKSFVKLNIPVYLFKIGNTTESKQRHFNDNIFYQNVDLPTALNISQEFKSIITATDKTFHECTDRLLKNKSNLIIHDPTEMKGHLLESVKKHNTMPITIRAINVGNLRDLGIVSFFIKHPYIPYNKQKEEKTNLAVATSRIDFDKHTDIIIKANQNLKEKIKIYGAENRLYTFHKLDKIDDKWRKNYYGTFSNQVGGVFNILNKSKYMIDMSAIKRDGGGSQYTFLEGWDSRCIIILNKKWDIGSGNIMEHNKNCLYVENESELTTILEGDNDYESLINQGLTDLQSFNGEKVAKEYLKLI
jgi:hypothetical protein